MFNGQASQDKFVCNTLKYKTNGFFVEIGSHDYIKHNNTYYLEKQLNWKGIMIDIDMNCLSNWKIHRTNSIHIINDATKIDYLKLFTDNNVPKNIDYLQIDLDVCNRSTLDCLEKLDKTIFDKYTFSTITFEHDIYTGNFFNTQNISRQIFLKRGYILVFPNISCNYLGKECIFEDWYVHPDLVDMDFVNKIKKDYTLNGNNIIYN
jgi:hypothetical protein